MSDGQSYDQIREDMQTVELSIEQAKEQIALDEALKRLVDNKDFKLVITDNYLNKEAERVVGARADAAMIMNEIAMIMLENQITAIGGLRQYFLKIQQRGMTSKMAMAEYQETQTELMTELGAVQ